MPEGMKEEIRTILEGFLADGKNNYMGISPQDRRSLLDALSLGLRLQDKIILKNTPQYPAQRNLLRHV